MLSQYINFKVEILFRDFSRFFFLNEKPFSRKQGLLDTFLYETLLFNTLICCVSFEVLKKFKACHGCFFSHIANACNHQTVFFFISIQKFIRIPPPHHSSSNLIHDVSVVIFLFYFLIEFALFGTTGCRVKHKNSIQKLIDQLPKLSTLFFQHSIQTRQIF